ncbi:DUF6541 family protein [Microbacterium tumbae]
MTWFDALPAILFACVVVIGPGLVATAPLPLGALARTAVSGLVGVCLTGLAATVFGALGMPLSLWQVAVPSALGLGVSMLLRRRMPRIERRIDRGTGWLAILWILSSVASAVVAFVRVPSPERISQTYDNVFHLSAASAIMEGFSASPFTLRSLIETDGGVISYYPSAWHSFAALTAQTVGVPVPVAFNAVWIAVISVLWLPGIAWLVRLLVPGRIAPLVAMPLGVSFGWFPYSLLTWGTIYPTALAHALLPAATGLGILAAKALIPKDALLPRRGATRRGRWTIAAAGVLVAGGALAFSHPRVLPTWALILAPYVLWRLGAAYRTARREGGPVARRARVILWGTSGALVVVAVAALGYAVIGLGLFDEPLSDRLNGPQARARQTLGDAIAQVLTMQVRMGAEGIVTGIAPLLAIMTLVGVVVALRRPDLRWLVVSYLVFGALYVLATGSDDDLTKLLTGIWYKDGYRLAATLPVLAVPLAALGVVTVPWLFRVRSGSLVAGLAAALGIGTAVTAMSSLAVTGVSEATGFVFRQPPSAADREIVSAKQIAFFEDVVPDIVPADQLLLGDPWDGSALSWMYAHREPVFPHVNGLWDRSRRVLAWNLARIESDPEVCEALDDLRVRYVIYNPHAFAGGDPAGNHFPAPHAAVEAGLFEPVATDGESTLYRIDQCGPLD